MPAETQPELSILIVSYNVREDIARCLASLPSTVDDIRYEVMVIDNASSDDSASYIRANHPQVELVENQNNIGFAAAVNQGLGMTSSDFVLLLNPDTAVRPGTIECMLGFMQDHAACGICGARLLNTDGSPQESDRAFPTPFNLVAESLFLKKLFSASRQYPAPREVDAVVGACLMARRTMIEEIGPMDERFFLYSEEVDWCLRAKQKGWRVFMIPDAQVVHGLGRSSADQPGTSFVELYRSRALYMRKHFNPLSRWVTQIGLFLGVLLRIFIWRSGLFFIRSDVRSIVARKKYTENRAVLSWYFQGCPNPHTVSEHLKGNPD